MIQKSLLLACLWCLGAATPGPAQESPFIEGLEPPTILLSQRSIVPGTQIEVNFPVAMVFPEAIGSTTDNYLLSIDPAWKGKPAWKGNLVWKTPRTAVFQPSEAPPMGTQFTFSVPESLVGVRGETLAAAEPVKASSPSFEVVYQSHTHHYYRHREHHERLPRISVAFEDLVDVESLKDQAVFRDSRGREVAAEVKQLESTRYRSWGERWATRLRADTGTTSLVAAESALYQIMPASRLPIGVDWKLHLSAGISSADNEKETGRSTTCYAGQVKPLEFTVVHAINRYNLPKVARVDFTKDLHPDLAETDLKPWIDVNPKPSDLSVTWDGARSLLVTGAYKYGRSYEITANPGILARDGTSLRKSASGTAKFEPIPPGLGLPSTDEVQLRHGKKTYPILAQNLSQVRVRVKALRGNEVQFARSGYDSYLNKRGRPVNGALPYRLIAGETVKDEVFVSKAELDHSENFRLDWNRWLEDPTIAALFLHAEGKPKSETKAKPMVTQALIQLTDLGVVWKRTPSELFCHVYSYDTGSPVEGARLRLLVDEGRLLGEVTTDASGIGRLANSQEAVHLGVDKGSDHHIIRVRDMSTYSPWHFSQNWSHGTSTLHHSGMLFTDRNLYRPGETVHLKGLLRTIEGSHVGSGAGVQGVLLCFDGKNREIFRKDVSFSRFGSSERYDRAARRIGRLVPLRSPSSGR